MILRRRVSLAGKYLDAVDDRVLIQSIEPGAGKDTVSTVAIGGDDGSRVTGARRESLDVVVKFSINEKSYHPAARYEVFEKIMAWAALAANGAWLRVNYKENKRLCVFAAQLPAEGDILSRGNQYSITFRACGVPWWSEDTPWQTMLNSLDQDSIRIDNRGTKRAPLELTLKNRSGATVDSVQITQGTQKFQFTGLGLANNETLVIDHANNGKRCTQRIRILGADGKTYRSALAARTGSDEIWIDPGTQTVTVRAAGVWTVTLICYGRFW